MKRSTRTARALDRLVVHKAAIEAHLSRRSGELFALENEVLLSDVTSIYFKARRQRTRWRSAATPAITGGDCKQVLIALIDIAPTSLPQRGQVLLTRHTAVGDPDA